MGGNIRIQDIVPDTIDIREIDRFTFLNKIYDIMQELGVNKDFYFFGSFDIFADKSISTCYLENIKPVFGDVDICLSYKYQKNILKIFNENCNKEIAGCLFYGMDIIAGNIHTIFDVCGINVQIDLDFVDIKDNEIPFVYFGKSSNIYDLSYSIKGTFHKLLLNAINAAHPFYVTEYTPGRKKIKGKILTNKYTFYIGKGLREIWEKDDEGRYSRIQSKDFKYIDDLTSIFKILFNKVPNTEELSLMWSFYGLVILIKENFNDEEIKNILKSYISKIFSPTAKMFDHSAEKNYNLKMNTVSYLQKNIKHMSSYIESEINYWEQH